MEALIHFGFDGRAWKHVSQLPVSSRQGAYLGVGIPEEFAQKLEQGNSICARERRHQRLDGCVYLSLQHCPILGGVHAVDPGKGEDLQGRRVAGCNFNQRTDILDLNKGPSTLGESDQRGDRLHDQQGRLARAVVAVSEK